MKLLAFCFALSASLFAAVDATAQTPAYAAEPSAYQAQTPDYQLGPGDLISIHVSGLREFDRSTRVSNSGRIRVPYVGVVFVAGMTSVQAEREIARLMKEHELINEPSVRVQVEQHRAQLTYVIGEVNAPGQFVVTGEMYLLDLIGKGGGLLPSADTVGHLYRRSAAQPNVMARIVGTNETVSDTPAAVAARAPSEAKAEEIIKVNFQELREGKRPELNVRLRGGDVLHVPRRLQSNIYIIGDVIVPGSYTLPRSGQITAAQAIIYAGGPLPTAKTANGFLMRHDANGVRQAIPVDFAAILDGKEPDIPILANDIIFIPNSNVKTIGIGLLNLVPRLLQQFLIF
jgi:polysaccharide export outer membrane protein